MPQIECAYPKQLPFRERLQIIWDFESQIKHIWLTGYILITWETNNNSLRDSWEVFGKTLSINFYKGGSYG